MNPVALHSFHIPVLGLAYTIDSPLQVARFGISSVISIIEDALIEKMRQVHSLKWGYSFSPIPKTEEDSRAKRITAYLNLVQQIVSAQVAGLKRQLFENGSEIMKFFEMLPEHSLAGSAFRKWRRLPEGPEKEELQSYLRSEIKPGAIEVNIMSKVDNLNYDREGKPLPPEYSDALSSLRGFANSDLDSGVVFSAGYNPRLYQYIAGFGDFFPGEQGLLKKKVILKVSDYRSALIQGKILAKKGIWVSEFRIESGLNCGGHAFATDGILLGVILQEFSEKRAQLEDELWQLCNTALAQAGRAGFPVKPQMRITVQGGIGTAGEDAFLRAFYRLDGTGWGSPFLLVPEATTVDDETLHQLATAAPDDYYLSDASPLGVPFHNFRPSSGNRKRIERITKNRPGSPCYKKFLSSDTEFTEQPICTASRQYQNLKIMQLEAKQLPPEQHARELHKITEKECLCDGLSSTAFLKNDIPLEQQTEVVTICPGPNLAYFSGIFTLRQMVDHIYGRDSLLNKVPRPHMFVNELELYVSYLRKKIGEAAHPVTAKQSQYFITFRDNLLSGISYYRELLPALGEDDTHRAGMLRELDRIGEELSLLLVPAETACLPSEI